MTVETLGWDSAFFGRKVTRLDLRGCSSVKEASMACDKALSGPNDATCYIVSDSSDGHGLVQALCGKGLSLLAVGSIVEYEKDTLAPQDFDHKSFRRLLACTPEVERLGCESGKFSRFARDPILAPRFRDMYRQWIGNAFRDSSCGCIGAFDGDDLCGILSFEHVACGLSSIELLSVSQNHRRRGFGRGLINAYEDMMVEKNAQVLRVKTQGCNTSARALYEALGFGKKTESWIWHIHSHGVQQR